MEVKAVNVHRGDEINIVSDNGELITNIILRELCSLDEVADGVATYKTRYDFDIKNQDELTNHILLSAQLQTTKAIHTVHIITYYDEFPCNQISFYYYS